MSERYLLDSSVILDHLRGRGSATSLLARLVDEEAELLVCEASVAEAFAAVPAEAREAVELLVSELELVATDLQTARAAGEIRHSTGSSLDAALVAANALRLDAQVIVSDGAPRDAFQHIGVATLSY